MENWNFVFLRWKLNNYLYLVIYLRCIIQLCNPTRDSVIWILSCKDYTGRFGKRSFRNYDVIFCGCNGVQIAKIFCRAWMFVCPTFWYVYCGAIFNFSNDFSLFRKKISTRIIVRYKACHVTYNLKISSVSLQLADQSGSLILNTVLWLVGQP